MASWGDVPPVQVLPPTSGPLHKGERGKSCKKIAKIESPANPEQEKVSESQLNGATENEEAYLGFITGTPPQPKQRQKSLLIK